MKYCIGLLVALLALNGVFALPAGSPNDDAEVIDVPRRRPSYGARAGVEDTDADPDFKDFKGVIDTGVGYPFLQPEPHPFSLNFGFFDSFEDIFRRLRTRLWPIAIAGEGDDNDETGDTAFGFDPKKGNTTSTVKVVDGHKIEVNETVYGDDNNVFRVRVVNIRPVDSDEEITGTDDNTNLNPVTSAPTNKGYDEAADDSDERREPLDKKVSQNEIGSNIDDPEVKY